MQMFTFKRKAALLLAALLSCLALSSCVGYSGDMEGRVSLAPASASAPASAPAPAHAPIHGLYNKIPLASIASIDGVTGSIGVGEAVFHAFSEGGERMETLSTEALLAYESPYADASSAYYKRLLAGDMRLPYMAMLYAADNGFERAYFSSLSLTVEDLYKSYSYLTCDDPFFESNYNINVEYLTPGEGDAETPVFYCLYSTVLEAGHMEKKLTAYARAKELIAALPGGLSEAERAEYLYRKLTETTHYLLYDEGAPTPDYLYDALVLGASNCDGFANALSLLFNLAGVDSVLALGSDEGAGHAWVMARLGNSYYHFDPTYDSDVVRDVAYGGKLYYFRLSDAAAFTLSRRYDQDISNEAPKCADASYDGACADMAVDEFVSAQSIAAVANAFEADIKGDDGCLVVASDAFLGAAWSDVEASFEQMADEVNFAGTVDAYLFKDRGLLVLYGKAG